MSTPDRTSPEGEPRPARPESGATPASGPTAEVRWPRKLPLFGVRVSVTDYEEAVGAIMAAARRGAGGVVTALPVHGVVAAARDGALGDKIDGFELVAPDGQPVRWALNALHGARLSDRVYGPELMLRLCRCAAAEGIGVYLYGSGPEVVERLGDNLLRWYPGLRIAGRESPPFRVLAAEEDRQVVARIRQSGARLLFLGLGCPLQDEFAFSHRHLVDAVQVCVGAAFDFHSGNKQMAPTWMQRRGLEWLHRLAKEPRRLWRRYLLSNTRFLAMFAAALLNLELPPWRAGAERGRHRPL
jgi:N-acetylglucosaminyldiphosphoundecaprenol N-acetyl-beta-D-mannosaminyltransferase